MAYIYDLTDTWNAGGTTFYGIKLNVTNTASASGSKLLSLQIGGSELFGVDKNGNVGIGTTASWAKLQVSNAGAEQLEFAPAVAANVNRILSYNRNTNAYNTMRLDGADYQFYVSGSERMRIDGTGNVGIGTSAPARLFEVVASGTNIPARLGNSQGNLDIGGSDGSVVNIDTRSWAMGLQTGGTERMRIDSSGSVVIGASSAAGARFNVTTPGTADVIYVDANTGGTAGTAVYVLPIRTAGSFRGGVRWNGTAVEYNTSSDARLKENIAPADDAAALIDAIQVRKFDWKETGNHQRYGMVAQELLEVAPEAVSVPADEDQMMGVDYSKLVPMLIKEVQSLRARVAQLEGN